MSSVGEPLAEGESFPESAAESIAESVSENIAEPIGESVAETVGEAIAEGVPEPYPEAEPIAEIDGDAEPEGESVEPSLMVSFIFLYSVIILLVVIGNCLVATVIIKSKLLKKNKVNWFLLSLIVARVVIGLFVVPARITGLFSEEYLQGIICKLCHYVGHGSSVASVFSIVGISITNYWRFVKEKDLFSTKKGNLLALCGVWLTAFVYSIHSPVTNDLVSEDYEGVERWACKISPYYYPVSRYLVLLDCTIMFIIPFGIIMYCYVGVIRKLSMHLQPQKVTPNSEGDSSGGGHRSDALQQIRMIVTLMTLFTICSLAPAVCKIYHTWDGPLFGDYQTIITVVFMFSYSNAWYNIIVFVIFRADIRKGFLQLYTHCKRGTAVGVQSRSDSTKVIFVKNNDNDQFDDNTQPKS